VFTCASCGRENPDDAVFCNGCGAALAPPAQREVRKTVSVLFCDVTGSTALGESTDPEALRELLARYFERMKAIVESHGGSVEKFIGDAVMVVFGVPQVHEDDALRACRAAVEMRDALPELRISGRIGVNTGEVVTGTEFDEAERLAAEGRESADPDDPVSQALWRQVTARVHAQRGSHAGAEKLAREAVVWIGRTDGLWTKGDALSDLATVLDAAGRRQEALASLREALALYEQKGIVPVAQRTRERLAAPQSA